MDKEKRSSRGRWTHRAGRGGWLLVTLVVAAALLIPLVAGLSGSNGPVDDPWSHVREELSSTDHSSLMPGPYMTGEEVTRACLQCHEAEGREVMRTAHWNWEGEPVEVPGHDEPVRMGKKNVINNFCISVQSNWSGCTSCHVGYGWEDERFDFTAEDHVDCLVCHDHSGQYGKTSGGYPSPGVDLTAAAQSVGPPNREDCGGCHFRGGGGDAVKHGDLDETLSNPRPRVDVHMGAHGLVCIDCHRTVDHDMRGRALSVSIDDANQVQCVDCHAAEPHQDARLNAHVASLACETCHIPEVAIREATKVHWDWSAAGQELPDTHEYLKRKGRFEYEQNLLPEYYWFNGRGGRYLLGDTIPREGPAELNPPQGSIRDPEARIWPFKVHRAEQPYDEVYRTLMVPKVVGEGGYWEDYDWDQALRLGSEVTRLPYSGRYGFTNTVMYWPLSHMVQPAGNALQCRACHAPDGRMDWDALGYPGDPAEWGGRELPASPSGDTVEPGGER